MTGAEATFSCSHPVLLFPDGSATVFHGENRPNGANFNTAAFANEDGLIAQFFIMCDSMIEAIECAAEQTAICRARREEVTL